MEKIKIIHQIWCNKYNDIPDSFLKLSATWKELHPDWEYRFWTEKDLNSFVHDYYPQYEEIYFKFPFDIQRWDAVRYLILDKLGGLYVDFDYECIQNVEPLLERDCCFAMDPVEHVFIKNHQGYSFNNSLIYATPHHDFIKTIVKNVFSEEQVEKKGKDDTLTVLLTTGLLMLSELYRQYEQKDSIHLIPATYVSPLSYNEIQQFHNGTYNEAYINEKINVAYAIHYFSGSWRYCRT